MAPAVRTRSNSKVTSTPAVEDPNTSPLAATPSEIATSGYPGKPSDKGKGVPKAFHFKNGAGNTYTDTQTAKISSVPSSASAHSANSFSPLVPLQEDAASDEEDDGECTLEEELARTLIGSDVLGAAAELANNLDKGKGKETEVTPSSARTVSPKILDAGKQLARKLAGRPSTLAPIPTGSTAGSTLPWSTAVVAAATAAPVPSTTISSSPFLAPSAGGAMQTTTAVTTISTPAILPAASPATVAAASVPTPTSTNLLLPAPPILLLP
ncbi:hypothetical protein B0H13DRAFT_2338210 [Mycena leptocephala]|nr:hypothetical protein B0H13DRAFT_2338210 [Mycena leptocephala]